MVKFGVQSFGMRSCTQLIRPDLGELDVDEESSVSHLVNE